MDPLRIILGSVCNIFLILHFELTYKFVQFVYMQIHRYKFLLNK
jgi:hypothetical protein